MENVIKGFMAKYAAASDETSIIGVMPNLRSGMKTRKSHGVINQSKPKSNVSIAPRSDENPYPTPTAKLAAMSMSAGSGGRGSASMSMGSSSSSKGGKAVGTSQSTRSKSTGTSGGNRGLSLGKSKFGKPTGKLWTSVFKF